ncbi:hypothetical protein J6590_019051 [Homalodisca vitripennis]|nr:hypothetical protein J6590_019051 [Homalodisca vitripennis]
MPRRTTYTSVRGRQAVVGVELNAINREHLQSLKLYSHYITAMSRSSRHCAGTWSRHAQNDDIHKLDIVPALGLVMPRRTTYTSVRGRQAVVGVELNAINREHLQSLKLYSHYITAMSRSSRKCAGTWSRHAQNDDIHKRLVENVRALGLVMPRRTTYTSVRGRQAVVGVELNAINREHLQSLKLYSHYITAMSRSSRHCAGTWSRHAQKDDIHQR